VVQLGRRLGRTLGFPTANVAVHKDFAQRRGVYATVTELSDGRRVAGVASLGLNPTVPNEEPRLEVWLFDFDEDLYGQEIRTELIAFIRDERRFDGLEALRGQVMRDAETARTVHEGSTR